MKPGNPVMKNVSLSGINSHEYNSTPEKIAQPHSELTI